MDRETGSRPSAPASSPALIVSYDGECAICTAAAGRLGRLDQGRRLRLVPLQRAATEYPALVARVGSTEMSGALHVFESDGSWSSGSEAVLRIVDTIPRLRPIDLLGRLPVVSLFVEPLYRLIAQHRHRLSRILG